MTCPTCGGAVTVTTNSVGQEPGSWFEPRRGTVTVKRALAVQTWAGCNRCEWCGPVADARKAVA